MKKIVIELFRQYSLEMSEGIQRPFEWDEDCIRLFYDKNIIQDGLKFMKDPNEYASLSDVGSIILYKREKGTSTDFYLDDGGHRVLAVAVMFATIKRLIDEYELQKKEEYDDIRSFISVAVKGAKKNVIPQPLNAKDFENILENSVCGKSNGVSHLISAYYISYSCFKNLYLQSPENFLTICNFITGHLSFEICQYEFASMSCRKIKYNEINNTKKDQNPIHRALSTLQEDASSLGVENFIEKTLYAKNKISNAFPQTDSDKKIHNPYMGTYLTIKIMSAFGEYFTSSSAKTKVDKVAKTVILNGKEEDRVNFYKTLYDDIDLFCALWNGSLELDIQPSKANNIHLFAFASIKDFLFSAHKQDHISTLIFRIVKSVFKINDRKIVGIKEGLDENVVWHLMHMLFLFRFYELIVRTNGTDARKDLREQLGWGEVIKTNEQLVQYDNAFTSLANELLSNEVYKTSLFAYKKGKDISKLILAMANIDENNLFESFGDIAIKFTKPKYYQIDHIVHEQSALFENNDTALSKKDILGNLRLLPTLKNKQENNPRNLRVINQQDVAFPEYMKGKAFSIEDIDARQKWLADKVRRLNEHIYTVVEK